MSLALDASDVLLTFAEIAVAFGGFASIVAIFQRTSSGSEGVSFDLFRFWMMLEFSLAALFFSLLPFPLLSFGLSAEATWSAAGGAMTLFVVAHVAVTSTLIRRGEPVVVTSLTRTVSAIANAAFSIILVSQALNLTGLLGRTFGPYLLGLFLLLFGAGVNFVRLVWVGNPPLTR